MPIRVYLVAAQLSNTAVEDLSEGREKSGIPCCEREINKSYPFRELSATKGMVRMKGICSSARQRRGSTTAARGKWLSSVKSVESFPRTG